jgi:putative nucleotidyltransferase with HDIG domain
MEGARASPGDANGSLSLDAWLIAENGAERSRRYRVSSQQPTHLGRGPDNDIVLTGDEISRHHCRIEPTAEGFLVRDTSRNGTFVNGASAEQRILADADRLTVGPITLRFAREEAAASASASGCAFAAHTRSDHGLQTFDRAELEPEAQPSQADARLETLYRTSELIHTIEDSGALLETIAGLVQETLQPERLFVLREQAEGLDVVAQRVPQTPTAPRLSRTILDKCVQDAQRVLCPDALLDEDLGAGQSIAEQRIRSVMAVPLESHERILGAIYLDSRQRRHAFDTQQLELLSAIGRQAGVALERAGLIDDLERLANGSIRTLVASVEAKDRYTRGHSERVASFAMQIAQTLGCGQQEVERIHLGALLHDVGKIGVPDAVLKKPEVLNEEEMARIREHPAIGERIVRQIDHPRLELAQQIARWHHERPDGRGYPDGLTAARIPQPARIVAAADAFDAMHSPRPYRAARAQAEIEAALEQNQGTQFDPDAAAALLALWRGGKLRTPETVPLAFPEAEEDA